MFWQKSYQIQLSFELISTKSSHLFPLGSNRQYKNFSRHGALSGRSLEGS